MELLMDYLAVVKIYGTTKNVKAPLSIQVRNPLIQTVTGYIKFNDRSIQVN